jgi:adenine phosphoribosyltransferase
MESQNQESRWPDQSYFENMITSIPDYPQKGVVFKDITTLLKDPEGFARSIDEIADHFMNMGITKVVGAEARGFMTAAPVAYRLGAGFVPARKPGKLPRETYSQSYDLEYGTDSLEIHKDALDEGDRVLLVDDLIATGGTTVAQIKLLKNFNCTVVGMGFLMELDFLNPRDLVQKYTDADMFSVIHVN